MSTKWLNDANGDQVDHCVSAEPPRMGITSSSWQSHDTDARQLLFERDEVGHAYRASAFPLLYLDGEVTSKHTRLSMVAYLTSIDNISSQNNPV